MSSFAGTSYTAAYLAETRVPHYLAGCIAPLAVTTLFILARIYSRAVILKIWGIDDTLITLSWFGSVILTILDYVLAYTVRLVYQLVLSGTKLGICCFYLRVFTERRSRHIVYGLMTFIVLFTIPLLLVQIFQCNPVADFWALSDQNCPVDELTVVYATGVFNILADLLLLVFVVPKIWNLRMAARQKIALMAILSTSLLVIIAAIIRTKLVAELADNTDPSWNDTVIALWSVIEVNTGMFCVAVAAIKPLVRRVFPSLLSSSGQSSNTRTKGATTRAYGIGTTVRSQAFELQSAHDTDRQFGGKTSVINTFWTGSGGPPADSESERHVLGPPGRIDIMKTVDVLIVDGGRDTFLDGDQSSDGSMKRFEHV